MKNCICGIPHSHGNCNCSLQGEGGRCCTKISDLAVKVGKLTILDDIHLHIHCGELTVLIGKNGAGKSTLLKAILGEIPHKGTVSFVNSRGKHKPVIGYVPQKIMLPQGSPTTVEDLVLSTITKQPVWLIKTRAKKTQVKVILQTTGAENLVNRRLCDLSGGEIQRVLLALSLEPKPDILLLDEPVSGVDQNGLVSFYETVDNLRKNYDMTILLISHDLELVSKYADRVILLDKRILAEGKPEEVYKSTAFCNVFGTTFAKTELGIKQKQN